MNYITISIIQTLWSNCFSYCIKGSIVCYYKPFLYLKKVSRTPVCPFRKQVFTLEMARCRWQTSQWSGTYRSHPLSRGRAEERTRGKVKRRKKPRHPAEEQSNNKSLNCNQRKETTVCLQQHHCFSTAAWAAGRQFHFKTQDDGGELRQMSLWKKNSGKISLGFLWTVTSQIILSTPHVPSGGHGFENWRVKWTEASRTFCTCQCERKALAACEHCWSCCLFIGSCSGKAPRTFHWKSIALFSECWQPRRCRTQVRLSWAQLQTGAWTGTADREKARWQWVRGTKAEPDSLSNRHRGHDAFHLLGDLPLFPWVSVSQRMKQKFKTQITPQTSKTG